MKSFSRQKEARFTDGGFDIVKQAKMVAGSYNSHYFTPFPLNPNSFRGRVENARRTLRIARARLTPEDIVVAGLIATELVTIGLLRAAIGRNSKLSRR